MSDQTPYDGAPEEEEATDAVIVEEVTGQHVDVDASSESHAAGSALAVRAPTREVLMPMDADTVIQGMEIYQALLPKLLKESDWQQTGDGKFVKKSGWRKIARAFNLSVVRISDKVERDLNGEVLRAEATYRAIAPNGQTQDGDGYCAREESRFASDKGRAKLENDLRATATTRAKNRAISDLVGMGEVSAEEVGVGGGDGDAPATATQEQVDILNRALLWLFEGDEGEAKQMFGLLERTCGGMLTGQAADAVVLTLSARKRQVAPPETPPAEGAKGEEKEAPAGEKKDPPKRESKEQKARRERKERKDAQDAAAVAEQDAAAEAPDPPAPDAADPSPEAPDTLPGVETPTGDGGDDGK